MEDVPPVDSPQDLVDEPHLRVDELQVLCVPYTPSFKRSLEDIYLLEFDGAGQGKKRSQFMKRRRTQVESTCAKDRSLCSRGMLKRDGWLEMWTVHSVRYKLLHDPR